VRTTEKNGESELELAETAAYFALGLDVKNQARLAQLGDLTLGAQFNVTGAKDPREIERFHFLDSLALLGLPAVAASSRLADAGSGAGFPALVLALALPELEVTAIESQRKKCQHIERVASLLGLTNVLVRCARIEELGQANARNYYDAVVSRALAPLPVVAEYSLPLLRVGGTMIAMKGAISNQELSQAKDALAILGAGELEAFELHPFAEAYNRWVYMAAKLRATPEEYPRRVGVPSKRPLGQS
jgi:16S rRNA (guanine527-N7)-methyltransferase